MERNGSVIWPSAFPHPDRPGRATTMPGRAPLSRWSRNRGLAGLTIYRPHSAGAMGTIKSHLAQKFRRVEIARISIICIFTPPLPIIYEKVRINGNIKHETVCFLF